MKTSKMPKKVQKRVKKGVDYVDDEKLYNEMVKYKEAYNLALETNQEPPRLSNYIGECILLICKNLASKGNYRSYSYNEEFIGDAIENVVKYLHNFDHVKYKSPFNYISTIANYAFIRRIELEKDETYFKMKSLQEHQLHEQLMDNSYLVEHNDVASNFVHEYEKSVEEKKRKSKKVKNDKTRKTNSSSD